MTIRFPVDGDAVEGETFKYQNQLPKLPIPDLNDTAKRYLDALRPLQVKTRQRKKEKLIFILYYRPLKSIK